MSPTTIGRLLICLVNENAMVIEHKQKLGVWDGEVPGEPVVVAVPLDEATLTLSLAPASPEPADVPDHQPPAFDYRPFILDALERDIVRLIVAEGPAPAKVIAKHVGMQDKAGEANSTLRGVLGRLGNVGVLENKNAGYVISDNFAPGIRHIPGL